MLRQLIAVALTTGVAKKAWDRYQRNQQRRTPVDITDVIARPAAASERRGMRRVGPGRRKEGPGA